MQEVITELSELNKSRFKTNKEYYDFLMFHIQSHMVEIDELRENNDPHFFNEVADMAILARMLALSEGVDEQTFKERLEKFRTKIMENSQ